MESINNVMDELEEELRFIEFDKNHKSLKEIIDDILDEGKEKNRRRLGEG